jgi:hypothetical protein
VHSREDSFEEGSGMIQDMIEGPEAYKRFETAMKAVIAVPRAKVQAQIEEHKKQSALNPNRRGPKRKDVKK